MSSLAASREYSLGVELRVDMLVFTTVKLRERERERGERERASLLAEPRGPALPATYIHQTSRQIDSTVHLESRECLIVLPWYVYSLGA